MRDLARPSGGRLVSRAPVVPPLLALLAAGIGGCDTGGPPVCTQEFVMSVVAVVDSAGAAVNDAVVTSTLVRTGETLSPTTLALLTAGTYVVVDDGARGRLRSSGDSVRVTAEKPAVGTASAAYFYEVPGGCHIHKVSGPDTLSLR